VANEKRFQLMNF